MRSLSGDLSKRSDKFRLQRMVIDNAVVEGVSILKQATGERVNSRDEFQERRRESQEKTAILCN